MKKSNMLIAVFAVLAAASVAKADGFGTDFDGIGAARDPGLALSVDSELAQFVPEAQPKQEEFLAQLSETVVDGVIQGMVDNCKATGMTALQTDFGNLLRYGSMKEKMAFVYNKKTPYAFPEAIVARRFFPDPGFLRKGLSQVKSQTCMASHNEKVCTQRQVCRVVCAAAAGGAGAAAGGVWAGVAIGASGQICQELCQMLDECTNVTVCDQWVTDPGTGGLTDSYGNYRGREMDFKTN